MVVLYKQGKSGSLFIKKNGEVNGRGR